jgi:hypothetical protein
MTPYQGFLQKLHAHSHSGAKYADVLYAAWKNTYPGCDPSHVANWDMDMKLDTQTFVLAAVMIDGEINSIELTKDFVEDALSLSPVLKKPGMPNWGKKNEKNTTILIEPRCIAFADDAFCDDGSHPLEYQEDLLGLIGSAGKLSISQHGGKCPTCAINIPKETVIFFGDLGLSQGSPAGYHPGCFLREIAHGISMTESIWKPHPEAMRYALGSMGRTADEMRWRRRAKANCYVTSFDLTGGQDPTMPERHEWRCKCDVAPWNLTKAQRAETRSKYGVTQ